jgi:hypothetical protein
MVGAWVVSLLAPCELHNGCHADMAAGFWCNCLEGLEGDGFADDVDCWIGQYNMSSTWFVFPPFPLCFCELTRSVEFSWVASSQDSLEIVDCAYPIQLEGCQNGSSASCDDYSNHIHGLLNHERRCLTTFVNKLFLRLCFGFNLFNQWFCFLIKILMTIIKEFITWGVTTQWSAHGTAHSGDQHGPLSTTLGMTL